MLICLDIFFKDTSNSIALSLSDSPQCGTADKNKTTRRETKERGNVKMDHALYKGRESRMEIWIEPERALCLMLATFALEQRSNYPSVFGASVPRSQQPLQARAGTERPEPAASQTLAGIQAGANSPTTREPDERAGNCCQKPWKDFCKDRRCSVG